MGFAGRALVDAAAAICLVSFGWGMARHFRFVGKPGPAVLATALLAVVSAAMNVPALASRPAGWPLVALALYAASAALFWWAVSVTRGALAACGQGCVSARVVQAGPYRYIRHPFYLSYNLTWVAGFAATRWWPLLAVAAVMGTVYERAAREEERGFFAGDLAEEYRAYRERAGRYLPWPRLSTRSSRFG